MLKNRTLIGIILSPLFNSILSSKTKIIRLRQDIPQGVQITGSMLEAVEVGSMNLPADMQNDLKKIIGKYSVTAMFAGDSFNDKKLSDTIDTSDSLLRQLKPNETAMSVTVKSLANGLSGKLQQGGDAAMHRNMPDDLQSEASVAGQLSGIVSEETQLSVLSCVSDPKAEMQRKRDEQEEKADAISGGMPTNRTAQADDTEEEGTNDEGSDL